MTTEQITFDEKVDLRVENTSKLANIYYYSANGNFSDYYDSVGEHNDVYFDELQKMTELELNN